MTEEQYLNAKEDLISRLQSMRERDSGHIVLLDSSGGEDDDSECLDDPTEKSNSTERDTAKDEIRIFGNICLKQRFRPKALKEPILKLGPRDMRYPIVMGKVAQRGEDIKELPPWVNCNLSDYIFEDGRFDLLGFYKLQQNIFPTIYKLVVCLASIRTNEVGCERFFSVAGYVSCPRRTRLNVRNYECLAALKANMQHVYIDENWVVNQYLEKEKAKSWNILDSENDMHVLNLERELLAEERGVSTEEIPPISEDTTNYQEALTYDLT